MGAIVKARLDAKSQAALEKLLGAGFTKSQVVREAIRLVAEAHAAIKPVEIVGLGEHDSGVSDLSTNKRYLEGFGSRDKRQVRTEKAQKQRAELAE